MTTTPPKHFRLRSFVRRDGRRTAAQDRAYSELWPSYGLQIENGFIEMDRTFKRNAPTYLEIGFGTGQSLLALAKERPDINLIGVETHRPGVGALFLGIQLNNLTNLRVYYTDVVDVIEQCIPDDSLDGIQIFFPDPWQKRRHHERRLVQSPFIALLVQKLKTSGTLHLATDWEDYSVHMMRVLSQEKALLNLAGENQFATRSPFRPILSKFEQRAVRDGRGIWELQFQKL